MELQSSYKKRKNQKINYEVKLIDNTDKALTAQEGAIGRRNYKKSRKIFRYKIIHCEADSLAF